ncbi:hypothetical protein FNF27_08267 [Cafeteria roenbergensis]|uniref:Uncharacterized protein n=1 Tax=Cafeteria roenbergensis TaxID=33653 RepID=A0A5A8D685_CAFRO|nr:hypothetical protein FNF27_08267 [Cafeteria roenbergensis]
MLNKLSSQKQYMVIDLDDYMRTLSEEKRIKDNYGTDAEVLTAPRGTARVRQDFLESLPTDAEIAIYSSYDELEKMVRERLAIVKTL